MGDLSSEGLNAREIVHALRGRWHGSHGMAQEPSALRMLPGRRAHRPRSPNWLRGSRTILGAPGGEIPPGDSPICLPRFKSARRSTNPRERKNLKLSRQRKSQESGR